MSGTSWSSPIRWFHSQMRLPTHREPSVRRFHPYFRTAPSNLEIDLLIAEAEYQQAMSNPHRSSFALPSFLFEGYEIEILPSPAGSGDALDVQTVAGRRRMRLLTEYLVMCLDVILRRKRAEQTTAQNT